MISYGITDYRNIGIAEGLERLCNEVNNIKKVCAIYGAGHAETVHKYLMSPILRKKHLIYLPYDFMFDAKIREYLPDKDGWTLSRTF